MGSFFVPAQTLIVVKLLTAIECNKRNNIFTTTLLLTELTHHPAAIHFKTLCMPNGAPSDRQNYFEHQKVDE
jgi:hypothetical protein